MRISEIFNKGKTVLSFEVFPPKKDSPIKTIYNTLDELASLNPEFMSVTYSAGGAGGKGESTLELASYVKNKLNIESVAHLTCLNSTENDIENIISSFKKSNIENILALRGDRNPDNPPKEVFNYASDLVSFIKERDDFGLLGACCPEGHIESENIITDIKNLKKKVDAGTEVLISQMFFDNALFYDFLEKIRLAGIEVPVSAGIIPVTKKKQIERMVSLNGTSMPRKFTKMISRYEDKPQALEDAGIAYAIDQIVDLISNGVEGIHLYTMNKPDVARKITDSIKNLL